MHFKFNALKSFSQSSLKRGILASLLGLSLPITALHAAPTRCSDGLGSHSSGPTPQRGICPSDQIRVLEQVKFQRRPILKSDLQIKTYAIVSAKVVRITVVNTGQNNAGASVLGLTVRRINGTPVGRVTQVQVPSIPKGQARSVLVNTASILPNAVQIGDTTFRMDADFSKAIAESNENNNIRWHNLQHGTRVSIKRY